MAMWASNDTWCEKAFMLENFVRKQAQQFLRARVGFCFGSPIVLYVRVFFFVFLSLLLAQLIWWTFFYSLILLILASS